MKTLIPTLFLALICSVSFSQSLLDKGKQQIGFSATDMTSAKAYGAQIHLRYGYFVANKFQIGLDANSGARDFNIFYASAGPFVKYHLKQDWFSPFAVVSSDFGVCDYSDHRQAHYMVGVLSWNKYFFGGGLGFYGLKEHWGFETSIGYQQEYYNIKDEGKAERSTSEWTIPIKWRISYSF